MYHLDKKEQRKVCVCVCVHVCECVNEAEREPKALETLVSGYLPPKYQVSCS